MIIGVTICEAEGPMGYNCKDSHLVLFIPSFSFHILLITITYIFKILQWQCQLWKMVNIFFLLQIMHLYFFFIVLCCYSWFISDGPLSLTDTFAPMDRGQNDNTNLSQSQGKLSDSTTSLNNRQAPAKSPSRQNTLVKQTSIQSNQSEINGERKDDPHGIKFERLKNLEVTISLLA